MVQTENGKAFEYACVCALYEKYSQNQDVHVVRNDPLTTAEYFFNHASRQQQCDLIEGARAAVRIIDNLEPRLRFDRSGTLNLALQTDAAGQAGDVRDVLCIRHSAGWEIGLSCKHNHEAVKHSRLSQHIDFGSKWGLGVPCSMDYFDEIRPYFTELDRLIEIGNDRGKPYEFNEIQDIDLNFYVPILNAFIREMQRIASINPNTPANLIHYLMGEHDFYKVITVDSNRLTKVEAININGTLNQSVGTHRSLVNVPIIHLPTEFFAIRMKPGSTTTVEIVCNNAWNITLRLHSASTKVERSFKFDVQLTGMPGGFYMQMEPWDYAGFGTGDRLRVAEEAFEPIHYEFR